MLKGIAMLLCSVGDIVGSIPTRSTMRHPLVSTPTNQWLCLRGQGRVWQGKAVSACLGMARRDVARQGLEMVAMVHLWFDSIGYHCWPGWTRYGSAGRGIGVVRPV